MAKVKDPLHSIQARGSVEGITFSIWRGINTVRRRARPVRRARRTQPRNRSLLGYLSREYGELSINQMEAWENWATNHPEGDKFGGTFILSAIQAYIKLNHQRMRLFNTYSITPPVEDPPATVQGLTAVAGTNPGDVLLDWDHAGAPVGEDVNEIQVAGPFMSRGRRSVFSRFRFTQSVPGDDETDEVVGLTEEMWYWFRVRYVAESGMVTNWMYAQAQPEVTGP